MVSWNELATRLASAADDRIDRIRAWAAARRGASAPMIIVPYLGFGTPDALEVRGRILEDAGILAAHDDDSLWDNLVRMVRRFESDEIAAASVVARFGGREVEDMSDAEGYFLLTLRPKTEVDAGWHDVGIQAASVRHGTAAATARVLVPSPHAALGVISDIDDTVIETAAHDLWRMARNVMLGNARTRLPFAGVRELYEALQHGTAGERVNPVFYVSNGPWNLFDFIVDFMELNELPPGPILLRDYGFDAGKFLTNAQHKSDTIRHILETYPQLPFILIGDSGERDPEIYRTVVDEFPNRIAAVYIRDVTDDRRRAEVRAVAAEIAAHGVEMYLMADSWIAADHAAAAGFITHEAALAVKASLG